MDYDPAKPLPLREQEAIEKSFNAETESMATEGYSVNQYSIELRRKAVNVIVKHSNCEKFDAFIPYLALNYFDRYISRHNLPDVVPSVNDDVTLLAISCLIIAWKMRSESFKIDEFLQERNLNIGLSNILRVELMILHYLSWRMRAVTAISFVGYFYSMFKEGQGFKRRTINEIIIQAQGDITFTRFRPSVIAASALLAASLSLYPDQFEIFKNRIVNDRHVKEYKEDVTACVDLMTVMCKEKNIVMKTAEPESREGLRVKDREPSGSSQSSHEEAPNESPPPSSSTSKREGNATMEDTPETKKEAPMEETPETKKEESILHREGKAAMETPETKKEPPMEKTSEIQEEPESKQGPQMDFKLKWVTNENEDVTLDSPRFRPVVPAEQAENEDVDTESAVAPQSGCLPKCTCCNLQ